MMNVISFWCAEGHGSFPGTLPFIIGILKMAATRRARSLDIFGPQADLQRGFAQY